MDKLAVFIVLVATVAFLLFAGANYQQSAAEREYARAAMVREKSQARQDLLAGMLPYVALVAIIGFGGSVFVVVVWFVIRLEAGDKRQGEPGQLIMERYYVVLPEGAGRRAMWERLAAERDRHQLIR